MIVSTCGTATGTVLSIIQLPTVKLQKLGFVKLLPDLQSPAGQPNMTKTRLDTLKEEIFNVVPDMVNIRRGATSYVSKLSNLSQGIPYPSSFPDILVKGEEIPLPTERPCKVCFADAS